VQVYFIRFDSLDQTTRIHGETGDQGWHELARPQIHGYDCLGVCFITPSRFVSIGDEKVARVFDAPKRFVDTLTGLHVSKFEDVEVSDNFCEADLGASDTSLGPTRSCHSPAPWFIE